MDQGTSNSFKPHSKQQEDAFRAKTPIVLLATGIQFGKTTVGALWMKLKMHQHTDESDNFIITSPTYKILAQSTLPPFLRWMDGFGTYQRQDAYFQMANGGRCYFRTMSDPDSIVGITNVRAIYGDEAGLYSLYAWENIQARAAFKSAQTLLTTSPYTLNWVFKDLIRPKNKQKDARPDVTYIKARSIDNPYFPRDYYERMRQTMDERRFRAMFGGEWEKMDGLVYDCFDEDENSITPFDLPPGTVFYAGVDWGTTAPFVLVVRAITPSGHHYQVTEVYKTGLTILDMVQHAKQKCMAYPIKMFYCDPSSPGYIEEFNRAGLPASAADNKIRVGIDFHYELIKSRRYKVFRGDNLHTIDELSTYHYPSLAEVKADTKVEDQIPVKQNDHTCFVAGTLISTPEGNIPIEEIQVGQKVSTPFGVFLVTKTAISGILPTTKLLDKNGNCLLQGTPCHPILTTRGWKPLGQLEKTYEIAHNKLLSLRVLNILSTVAATWLGALKNQSIYIEKSIKNILEKYRKAWLYTTLITTPLIIARQIFNYLQKQSTKNTTKENLAKKLLKKELKGWSRTEERPQKEKLNTIAKYVKKNFTIQHKTPQFARAIVGALVVTGAAWTLLIGFVLSVIKHLGLINREKAVCARLNVTLSEGGNQAVYNLSIDKVGCYYANGILASNCDANRYLTLALYKGFHRREPEIISLSDKHKLTIDERMARIREPSVATAEEW